MKIICISQVYWPDTASVAQHLVDLLQALSGHYRDRMAARPEGDAGILAMLDAALEDVAMLPAGPVRKAAVAALAGIRRDLFRNTAPFPAGKSACGEDGHEAGLSVANGS